MKESLFIYFVLLIDLKRRKRDYVRRFATRTQYVFDGFVYHTNGSHVKNKR